MASSISLLPPTLSSFPQNLSHCSNPHRNIIVFRVLQLDRTVPLPSRLQASRRISNFPQQGDNLEDGPRNWPRSRSGLVIGDYDDDEDEDEGDDGDDDRSLDLLVRFVQNVFKKISRKARKAVRSVLPITISTKLVGFSVNGVIMLTFLWILKAFLEVVCTLGSIVFVSILFIHGIWTGITYLQDNRYHRADDLDDQPHAWTGSQPAT